MASPNDAAGIPLVTAGVVAAAITCSIASILSQTAFDALVLVPYKSYAIWTLVTCQFVEASAIKVALSIPVLFLLGRIAERRQGARNLAMVVMQSVFVTSVAAAAIELLNYGITTRLESLFVAVHGTAGLCAALCVAAFQADPEEVVGLGVRVRDTPVLLLLVLGFASLVGLSRDIVFLLVGFLSTWTYLRYFAPADDGRFGDPTEGFSFEKLWPEQLRPALRGCLRLGAGACLRLPCFRGQAAAPTAGTGGAPSALPGTGGGGGGHGLGARSGGTGAAADPLDDPVAQRRRDVAMKALNERLAEIDRRRKARNQQVKSALSMADKRGGGGEGAAAARAGEGASVPGS